MSGIFDTHAHYDDSRFDEDRDEVLRSLADYGVKKVVNIAADPGSIETTYALSKKVPFVYAALGVHPDGVPEMSEQTLERIRELVRIEQPAERKIVAIGEIGLDYYGRDDIPKELQQEWFVRQLDLSKELDLPVVIHSRDAAKDTFDILKANKTGDGAGIIHCFSYTKEMAREFLNLGYYIALGGVTTFKNAKAAKEVAAYVPADRLLLETDCPYLAPTPYRGSRNFSGYLKEIVATIAELRGVDENELIAQTWANAHRLYCIKETNWDD